MCWLTKACCFTDITARRGRICMNPPRRTVHIMRCAARRRWIRPAWRAHVTICATICSAPVRIWTGECGRRERSGGEETELIHNVLFLIDAAATTTACATTRRWSSRMCVWRARRSAIIIIITRAAHATATIVIGISRPDDVIIIDTAAAVVSAAAAAEDIIDQPWS